MAPHSSTLAWKIPWMEEPGGLQSMGSLRVRHDWATSLSLFTFMHWRRKWQPTPVFLPGESQDRGAWWAAIHGVTQSWTRLKWLSSSCSRNNKAEQKMKKHQRVTEWFGICEDKWACMQAMCTDVIRHLMHEREQPLHGTCTTPQQAVCPQKKWFITRKLDPWLHLWP